MSEVAALYKKAFGAFTRGDTDAAIAGFEKVVEADASFALAYQGLAEVYGRADRLDEAVATIKKAITLRHQANLGEDPEDVALSEGDEVTVLREWEDRSLCKNEDGWLFNIPKAHLDS